MAIVRIDVSVIPHKYQRYHSMGDWRFIEQWSGGNAALFVRVSDTGIEHYNMLLAMHEIWEALLCHERGITDKQVDEFDAWHLKKYGPANADHEEPGDHPLAPYRDEHCAATAIERQLCSEYEIPWYGYTQRVDEVYKEGARFFLPEDPTEGCHQGSSE
jgi:hypothetical protein